MNKTWQEKLSWSKEQLLSDQYKSDNIILSAISQIEYLEAVDRGEKEDSEHEKIDIGYLAMYSLADIVTYDLSVALCDISDKIRRVLRRQGRHLNIDRRK
jgi:predicted Kef-type K+ transport protein